MAKDFKTSVITLRKALKRLDDFGLLLRIHGSGNYVKQNNVNGSVYAMFRLELIGGGGLPRANILDVNTTITALSQILNVTAREKKRIVQEVKRRKRFSNIVIRENVRYQN